MMYNLVYILFHHLEEGDAQSGVVGTIHICLWWLRAIPVLWERESTQREKKERKGRAGVNGGIEDGREEVEGGKQWTREYCKEQGPTSFSVSNNFDTSSCMLASTCL